MTPDYQKKWAETYEQRLINMIERDAYRRGFEAAKAAALAAIDELVESAPLRQSLATLCMAHSAIKQLQPEVTR